MSFTEQDIRNLIRDEIAKAFGFTNQQTDIEFTRTREAAKILGYSNYRPLYKLIDANVLRLGIEVQDRRSPDSVNADYWFNIPACKKRLNTPPEKRA